MRKDMKIRYVGKCVLLESCGENALVIGDLHFGYEARLGVRGIDLGGERLKETIFELNKNLKNCRKRKINKIILLGDLKDDFSQLTYDEKEKIEKFLDYLEKKTKEIIIIKGNHDNYLLNLIKKRKIESKEQYLWKKCLFVHGDKKMKDMWNKEIKNIFMGHLHSSIRLEEGIKSEIYKCFLEGEHDGKRIVVVPSFAEMGMGLDVRKIKENSGWKFKWKNFRIKIVDGENGALDFGKIDELK